MRTIRHARYFSGLNLEPGRTYENTKNLLQRLQLEEDLQRGERVLLQMQERHLPSAAAAAANGGGGNYVEMAPAASSRLSSYGGDLASLPLMPFIPKYKIKSPLAFPKIS